jgi:hypothetical protein
METGLQISGKHEIPSCQHNHYKGQEGRIYKKSLESRIERSLKTIHHDMTSEPKFTTQE